MGAVLVDSVAYSDIASYLHSDDFYIMRHRWIWEAVGRLVAKKIAVDFMTVCEELDSIGNLSEVGGPAYLTQLISASPTSQHADDYAQIVGQLSVRRGLLKSANEMARAAYDESLSIDDVLDQSKKSVGDVCEHHFGKGRGKTADEINAEFREYLFTPKHVVKTYIPELDRITGGLFETELTMFAGAPGIGKTALFLQIARNAANRSNQRRVLYCSLEMATVQMWARMACPMAGLKWLDVRAGNVEEYQLEVLAECSQRLKEEYEDRLIVDEESRTPGEILRSFLYYQPDLLIVDPLQDILWSKREESPVIWMPAVCRFLRNDIAKKHRRPILLAHHINKDVDNRAQGDKRPQVGDIRWGKEIEAVVDILLMPYRHDMVVGRTSDVKEVPFEIHAKKHRQGDAQGFCILNYKLEEQWFD